MSAILNTPKKYTVQSFHTVCMLPTQFTSLTSITKKAMASIISYTCTLVLAGWIANRSIFMKNTDSNLNDFKHTSLKEHEVDSILEHSGKEKDLDSKARDYFAIFEKVFLDVTL